MHAYKRISVIFLYLFLLRKSYFHFRLLSISEFYMFGVIIQQFFLWVFSLIFGVCMYFYSVLLLCFCENYCWYRVFINVATITIIVLYTRHHYEVPLLLSFSHCFVTVKTRILNWHASIVQRKQFFSMNSNFRIIVKVDSIIDPLCILSGIEIFSKI